MSFERAWARDWKRDIFCPDRWTFCILCRKWWNGCRTIRLFCWRLLIRRFPIWPWSTNFSFLCKRHLPITIIFRCWQRIYSGLRKTDTACFCCPGRRQEGADCVRTCRILIWRHLMKEILSVKSCREKSWWQEEICEEGLSIPRFVLSLSQKVIFSAQRKRKNEK